MPKWRTSCSRRTSQRGTSCGPYSRACRSDKSQSTLMSKSRDKIYRTVFSRAHKNLISSPADGKGKAMPIYKISNSSTARPHLVSCSTTAARISHETRNTVYASWLHSPVTCFSALSRAAGVCRGKMTAICLCLPQHLSPPSPRNVGITVANTPGAPMESAENRVRGFHLRALKPQDFFLSFLFHSSQLASY